MKSPLRRCGIAVLASVFIFTFGMEAKAQVLDDPQIYDLPPFDPTTINTSGDGVPYTLDTGSLAGLTSAIGNATLNDVAIMSIPNEEFGPPPQGVESINGRVWSLVHTSTTDTRALAVASPVDVTMDFSDLEECYEFVGSVQILDLNGDDANDLAFLGPCFGFTGGFSDVQNVFGLQGNTSDPYQQSDSLTLLGLQPGGSLYDLDGGQLAMVAADFDGDGNTDLGYYTLDQDADSQALEVLLNNGTFGLLPNEISPIDSPIEPPEFDNAFGFEVATGDFDENGTADMAVIYGLTDGAPEVNELLVYSGNGDGTFQQTPMAQADLAVQATVDFRPASLTSGNFDSNDFSDFAVTWLDRNAGIAYLSVILCSTTGCNATALPFGQNLKGGPLVAADFDNDGFDDIADIVNTENLTLGFNAQQSSVQIHLNEGDGQFDNNPDQTLTLETTPTFDEALTTQVVTDDIDGCGGPDLAFTGGIFDLRAPPVDSGIDQGGGSQFEYQAAVAFNPNEAPTANAGEDNGVSADGGIQIGGGLFPGNPPTCSDPTNDAMEISWTQISGSPATISDTSAANPIVSRSTGTGDAVFQVTCTDACGLSDSDTVTVTQSGFLQGGGISCGLNPMAAGSAMNLTGPMILTLTGALAFWRKKRS